MSNLEKLQAMAAKEDSVTPGERESFFKAFSAAWDAAESELKTLGYDRYQANDYLYNLCDNAHRAGAK